MFQKLYKYLSIGMCSILLLFSVGTNTAIYGASGVQNLYSSLQIGTKIGLETSTGKFITQKITATTLLSNISSFWLNRF